MTGKEQPSTLVSTILVATFTSLAILSALVVSGCGGFIPPNLDFIGLLTCATDRQSIQADLQWVQFDVTMPADARPNDLVGIRMALIAASNQGDPVGLPSNLRLFLSFDQTLDSNDYLVGEYVIDNLDANLARIRIEDFRLPRVTEPPTVPGFEDAYFPSVIPDPDAISDPNYNPFDPNRPEYIGPQSITYNLIGVLDSANCVEEFNPNTNATEPATREDQRGAASTVAGYGGVINNVAINNQIVSDTPIVVQNPNLPNLTCRFRDIQPPATAMQGGIFLTDWEIHNEGVGPVLAGQQFTLDVYMSDDEDFDNWDVLVGTATVNGPMSAGQQLIERITCQLPYQVTRANTAATAGYTSVPDTAGGTTIPPGSTGQNELTRNPPPAGPPSVDLIVYAPIPNEAEVPIYLIGFVDSQSLIREQVENDNFSFNGDGQDGWLRIREAAPGGGEFDIIARSITAAIENGFLMIRFTMEITTTRNLRMSLGFYLSQDETATSADYFWNRFQWTSFGIGEQIAELPFPTPIPDIPAPTTWHFIGVADDILAIPETNENNNWVIDIADIRIN